MSDNIPFNIQLEIIKKVPDLKSLIRFISVSKQWKSFIESSEFIACYGVRHSQPNRFLIRYRDDSYPYAVKYVSFVDGDSDIFNQQQDFGPNVSLFVKQSDNLRVIGTSSGLWCLRGYSWPIEMLVIWNPSIRKSIGIVLPFVLKNTSAKMTRFGFGVCPTFYDPTIVIMSYCYGSFKRKDTHKWRVEVFSLSSKTWKRIPSSDLPRDSILRLETHVAIDRFINWHSYEKIVGNDGLSKYKKLILSFDLITHEFKEINLPHSLENHISLDFSLSKLSESLVVSTYIFEAEKAVYGVWMMGEEGGAMTSFTKLFNIKTPADSRVISKVLGFTVSGEPIMETEKDEEEFANVEFYKSGSARIHGLGINGKKGSFFISPYTETLLLVDYSNCCIISNDS